MIATHRYSCPDMSASHNCSPMKTNYILLCIVKSHSLCTNSLQNDHVNRQNEILYKLSPLCLRFLKYQERKVVAIHCLHQCGELHLASYNNCFLSRHDALFERKSFRTFPQVTRETTPFTLQWCNT